MEVNPNHDITGNAPMIPRSEVIAIMNELQLLQTRCLILLSKYEPEHFKEAKTGQPKIDQPVWASTGTGQPSESMVRTITGE